MERKGEYARKSARERRKVLITPRPKAR